MKNLFYLIMASALLVVSGCVKEEANNDNGQFEQDPALGIPMKTVTLDASMLAPVKSTVNEDGEFAWTADDAIAVNVEYTNSSSETVNAFFKFDVKEISPENDNNATFEGKIPETGVVTGVAVYPYDKGHVYAAGKLSVNFPAEVSESNHLPAMYAKVEGETLQFNHLSSMLGLTYKYVPKGTDGLTLTSEAVAGLYDVDLTTGALTVTENVTDQVKVSFAAVTSMQAEKTVYVPVPAGERSIAAELTKGEEMVKWSNTSSKSTWEFEAGKLSLLPAVNVHFSELYILGVSEDCYAWKKAEMKPLEETEDHVFIWSGDIFSGNRFRFPVEHNVYYPAVVYNYGDIGFYAGENNNDLDFTVEEHGNYTITVDTRNMDKISVNVVRNGNPDNNLYIIGKSTEWGNTKELDDRMRMTQTERRVFVWEGQLTDDNGTDFKFLTRNEWLPSYNKKSDAAEDTWILAYRGIGDDPDKKFAIENGDGIYNVTANLNTMEVTCEFITPSLYVIGNSVADSFTNKPSADYRMSYIGNGVFTWTGSMKIDTGNGFKIINYGKWLPCWGPVSTVGVKNASIGDGKAQWGDHEDRKWDLKGSDGYSAGTYTITLDTVNQTISVTPM